MSSLLNPPHVSRRRFTATVCLVSFVVAGLAGCDSGTGAARIDAKPQTTLAGYVGGEKLLFLQNEKIRNILAEKYGLAVNSSKAGSVEMVTTLDRNGMDFVWPSNDFAVELYRRNGGKARRDQIVFNSPIVIYTGWNIANALIKAGLVEKRAEGYFVTNLHDLVQQIVAQKNWKDLGLNFHGKISVRCTDPTRSNSGNMFAALVANTLNGGDVVDETSIDKILPQLKTFFGRLGLMEHSSDDIFRKFIATGTNNSMVVGYENQIVEFIMANPNSRDLIQNSVCVLYPEPTVWSSHPIVSLTPKGDALIQAMMDVEIQKLAWSEHGFRSGLAGVTMGPTAVNLPFMPETIDSVTPLPSPATFERILSTLQE